MRNARGSLVAGSTPRQRSGGREDYGVFFFAKVPPNISPFTVVYVVKVTAVSHSMRGVWQLFPLSDGKEST